MKTLGLVSCTKSKQNYPCKASQMYEAPDLFRKAYPHATKNYDCVAILNGKYGFLLRACIEPYDLTLTDKNAGKRKEWAERPRGARALDRLNVPKSEAEESCRIGRVVKKFLHIGSV